jgi:hypothetical protein
VRRRFFSGCFPFECFVVPDGPAWVSGGGSALLGGCSLAFLPYERSRRSDMVMDLGAAATPNNDVAGPIYQPPAKSNTVSLKTQIFQTQ